MKRFFSNSTSSHPRALTTLLENSLYKSALSRPDHFSTLATAVRASRRKEGPNAVEDGQRVLESLSPVPNGPMQVGDHPLKKYPLKKATIYLGTRYILLWNLRPARCFGVVSLPCLSPHRHRHSRPHSLPRVRNASAKKVVETR